MKRPNEHPQLPLHDYGLALQSAVSWLGERYLLAAPVAARRQYARARWSRPKARPTAMS